MFVQWQVSVNSWACGQWAEVRTLIRFTLSHTLPLIRTLVDSLSGTHFHWNPCSCTRISLHSRALTFTHSHALTCHLRSYSRLVTLTGTCIHIHVNLHSTSTCSYLCPLTHGHSVLFILASTQSPILTHVHAHVHSRCSSPIHSYTRIGEMNVSDYANLCLCEGFTSLKVCDLGLSAHHRESVQCRAASTRTQFCSSSDCVVVELH